MRSIANSYVKANKVNNLDLYLIAPEEMVLPKRELQKMSASEKIRLKLQLRKDHVRSTCR